MKLMTTIARTSLMALLFCTAVSCTDQGTPTTSETNTTKAPKASKIEWAKTWDAAFFRAKSEEKVVLVTFYADWCIWCKKLEDTTLSDSTVAAFLTQKTVPIRLDVDGDGRAISDQYRVDGLPTVLVLKTDGTELGRIPGYLPPQGFLERIKSLIG